MDKSNFTKPGACLIIVIENQFFAIKRFLSDRITIVVPMYDSLINTPVSSIYIWHIDIHSY